MSSVANKYATARVVLSLLAFFGWVTVAIGVFLCAIGLVAGSIAMQVFLEPAAGLSLGAVVPGFFFITTGLMFVASQQVGRAMVDGSIAAQETAEILRGRQEGGPMAPARTSPDTTRSPSRGPRTPPPLTSPVLN